MIHSLAWLVSIASSLAIPEPATARIAIFEKQLSQMNCRLEFNYHTGIVNTDILDDLRAGKRVTVAFKEVYEKSSLSGTWEILNGVEHCILGPSADMLQERDRIADTQISEKGYAVLDIPGKMEFASDGQVTVSVDRSYRGRLPSVRKSTREKTTSRGQRGPYDWRAGRFPYGFSWEECSRRVELTATGPGRIQYSDRRNDTNIIVEIQFDEVFESCPIYCRIIGHCPGHQTYVWEWFAINKDGYRNEWCVPVEYIECRWYIDDPISLENGKISPEELVCRQDDLQVGHFIATSFKPNSVSSIRLMEATKRLTTPSGVVRLPSESRLSFQEIVAVAMPTLNKPAPVPSSAAPKTHEESIKQLVDRRRRPESLASRVERRISIPQVIAFVGAALICIALFMHVLKSRSGKQ